MPQEPGDTAMATILIIDDSPTELHLFQEMLEKNGFATLVADSGEDGIRQAQSAQPDCILMDVVMPGMNGFQATRKLTQDAKTSAIPVIMITTKDQETDKIWGMRQGAVDYLVKPVTGKQLAAKIAAVMAR
ncbi:MAG: twitching motility response regulator PilH [Gammaproteobacteria bacterium]|nr:MAG: twitching motility response regulator PilH [Gammaproteobacteria bacterium]